MSKNGPTDDVQNRRRFLQLLGASGVATGMFGTEAAASGSSDPSVELFASAENYCGEGYCPPGIERPVPVGADIEFQAHLEGEYAVAEVKKDEVVTGGAETILTCGEGTDSDLDNCNEFSVAFDDTGVYEIRFEAWSDEGAIGSPRSNATTGGLEPVGECEEFEALTCDSITFRVFDPEIDLSVKTLDGSGPYEVGQTLVFTADVDPAVEPTSWTLESIQIDDEPADTVQIEAPDAGEVWARRPVSSGRWIILAIAEYDGETFTETVEIDVQSREKLVYSDVELTPKYDKLFASLDLENASGTTRTAKIDLEVGGNGGSIIIDTGEVELGPGQDHTVELDGEYPPKATYGSLLLDGESIARTEL